MEKHLTITAQFLVKKESVAMVKAELIKLVKSTRTEEGCINYDLHQDNENEHRFLMYETWENEEFLKAHMETEHFKAYASATKEALAEFTVHRMTRIA